MSKPTAEQMVDWWDTDLIPKLNLILAMQSIEWCPKDMEMLQAVREALTEKPTVSKMEFDIAANLAIVALDKLPKSKHYEVLRSMAKQLRITVSDSEDKEGENDKV